MANNKKSKPAAQPVAPVSRPQRVIAYVMGSMLGVGIFAIVALFIGGPTKSGEIWATVALLPLIAIPLAFVLLIVLIILNGVQKSQAAKGADK